MHHLNTHSGEELKSMLRAATGRAGTYAQVRDAVCEVVGFVASRERGITFVSGLISSDGPGLVDRNILVLSDFTDHIRRVSVVPVVSAADVFHKHLLDKYRDQSKDDWFRFWRRVLDSGVSLLMMTPRWHLSTGAKDEHEFAVARKIKVEYRHDDPELLKILHRHGVQYRHDEAELAGVLRKHCTGPGK